MYDDVKKIKMSGYDYRSQSGYASDSHPDHVIGSPIISYGAAHESQTYVRRVDSRVATAYKYPTSHVKVDQSMVNHGRPREFEELITQILDEVNGPPGLATSPNLAPSWGRHNSPVKMYPSRDYGTEFYPGGLPSKSKISGDLGDFYDHGERSPGHVYDQLPHRDYDIPNKGYVDQSHLKASRAYEAPKQCDSYSQHAVDDPWSQYKSPAKLENLKDYEAPRTQWGDSSIKSHTPGHGEVRKNQWEKPSGPIYDDRSPKYQSAEMLRGNPVGRPQSPESYEVPNNGGDWLSSYDQLPSNGNAGGALKNSGKYLSNHSYGEPNNHLDRWGNSLFNPDSPKDYGASNNQRGRSSSPIQDHSLPTKNTEASLPSSQLGNSLMKPQSPKDHGAPNNQWDRGPSSSVYDHSPQTKNIAAASVPSSRWGNSLMGSQSPKGLGIPNNQQNRSSSPDHDHPLPTKNTGGEYSAPRNRLGNSLLKPQSPKDREVLNLQRDKSSSAVHDHAPPTTNTSGAPSSRWGKTTRDHSVLDNNTSSPGLDHQLPTKNINTGGASGVPSSRWDNPLMKPQSPGDHGVPNNKWDKPMSPIRNPPAPTKKTGEAPVTPSSRWGNPMLNPQSPKDNGVPKDQWYKSPNLSQPPLTKNTGGVPNDQRSNSFVKSQSPKDNYGVSNHQRDHPQSPLRSPPPRGNIRGIPDNQWPNSPVQSQSVQDYEAPNYQWNKQQNSSLDHSSSSGKTGNIGGVPNYRLSDPAQPQSPKGYNQRDRSFSPIYDYPPPTQTTIGVPSSRLGNSSVKPQSPKVTNSPYDKQIVNRNDFHSSKPVDYSNHHQPNEHGSSNGMKPSGYHSSPPRQRTAPLNKVTNSMGEDMPKLRVATGRSPDYLTGSQPRYSYPASQEPKQKAKVYVEYIDSVEAARRYGGRSFQLGKT